MDSKADSDIEVIETEKLWGLSACIAGKPEARGQIVRVISYPGRRCYVLSYFWDGSMHEEVLEGFQLELSE